MYYKYMYEQKRNLVGEASVFQPARPKLHHYSILRRVTRVFTRNTNND